MTPASLVCPFCGRGMVLRQTTKYPRPGKPIRQFYGCSGWPACNATCGAHPDGSPCSTPADPATKQARIAAHDVFDRLWKSGRMSRKAAYRRLQRLMGMTRAQAHIGFFSKQQCEALMEKLGQSAEVVS